VTKNNGKFVNIKNVTTVTKKKMTIVTEKNNRNGNSVTSNTLFHNPANKYIIKYIVEYIENKHQNIFTLISECHFCDLPSKTSFFHRPYS